MLTFLHQLQLQLNLMKSHDELNFITPEGTLLNRFIIGHLMSFHILFFRYCFKCRQIVEELYSEWPTAQTVPQDLMLKPQTKIFFEEKWKEVEELFVIDSSV